jgi:hypothetical protein
MKNLINVFDRKYEELHRRSVGLMNEIPEQFIFEQTPADNEQMMKLTVGENLIRCAAFVEMTFGGITTRLWDDPFEWTLTEALQDRRKILEYLKEVETTRIHGFDYFTSDGELAREIPAPREMRSLGEILVDTLARAEHYQGRAFALYQYLSSNKLAQR